MKTASRQIIGLCERSFRKGFSHGYFAHLREKITPAQAEAFWTSGQSEGFRRMIDPISGKNIRFRTLEPESLEEQTERLVELQYRKGFLRGYRAGQNGETNPEKVYKYRLRSQAKRYPQVEHPITGRYQSGIWILHREIERMNEMDLLKRVL